MTNFSTISLPHSGTETPKNDEIFSPKIRLIVFSFVFVTCIFGLVGNGIVIWLLGFRMKRNPFAVYILNLAAADFGVLTVLVLVSLQMFFLYIPSVALFTADCLFTFLFCTSQSLLTAISIDRCVSVVFPIWHQCHRPPHLSTTVSALIWALSFLCCVIAIMMFSLKFSFYYPLLCQFWVNVGLCFPLITISTLTLFFKVCCKPKQHKRGKLLTVILLTLLVYLLVALPFSVVILHSYFLYSTDYLDYLLPYGFLCASLNSAINPLIYVLVGKKKRGLARENIRAILQRLFKEEEEFPEEPVRG